MPEPRTPQSPTLLSWSEWKAQHQQKPWYRRYPLAAEWLLEQVNNHFHRWAFVEFLEHVGKFTVLIAVIFWILEADNRARERHYRAWELINSARGSTADGGRIDALRDLNEDEVSLAGAPLEGAWLVGIDLQGANLWKADLKGTILNGAYLRTIKGFTQEQLDLALGDDTTQLPEHLTRPAHWPSSKSEEPAK